MNKDDLEDNLLDRFAEWVLSNEDLGVILDRCMEWLGDNGMLNEKGKRFAKEVWEKWVKE